MIDLTFLKKFSTSHCASSNSLYLIFIYQTCIYMMYFIMLLLLLNCSVMSISIDYSPPGSTVHGILQARILEWVAILLSRGSSWHRNQTLVSCISCWQADSLPLSHLRSGILCVYIHMCVCVCVYIYAKISVQHVGN